jgi:quercetin dioxygenase-like cupin family protein
MKNYHFVQDLTGLTHEIPPDSIISRTFHEDDRAKFIVFGFAEGQELSEHTASQPAMILFLAGEAKVTLGNDEFVATSGTWFYMQPRLSHSVTAIKPTQMLLILYKEMG